jgi:hypothetical protein
MMSRDSGEIDLRLQITIDSSEDAGTPAVRLRGELLLLDVEYVELLGTPAPDGSKGLPGVAEILAVGLQGIHLKAVVARIRHWVARNGHSVEMSIDGDAIKVVGPTLEQQEALVQIWLARHAAKP